ncbi:hypothetical protein NW768_011952 [Fusarium equiseti]|uniref:Uncharacterized protein n=1 Tax=Fusarium equiseti TaxID=61235 RepID=A0ABQ8QX06_FUSEQ|nr:hypothetical protein NW768_011952 [Fusarium equiseti]
MSRRNPSRVASSNPSSSTFRNYFESSQASISTDSKRSKNAIRKGPRDASTAKQPANAQSEVTGTSNSQRTTMNRLRDTITVSQPEVAQSNDPTATNDQDVRTVARRVNGYKSRLQSLKDEHKLLSRGRDFEAVSQLEKKHKASKQQRKQLGRNLEAIKGVVDQTTKTIKDGQDVVPLQLHDALKACKKKRDQVENKYNNIRALEIKEMRQLEDAKRKFDEANAKLENLNKQINKCMLNLRSAEKDMSIVLLQGRVRDVGHVDVSNLPYDQRLRLSTLIDQIKDVIDEGSVTSSP